MHLIESKGNSEEQETEKMSNLPTSSRGNSFLVMNPKMQIPQSPTLTSLTVTEISPLMLRTPAPILMLANNLKT
jgi:hypothetical protein